MKKMILVATLLCGALVGCGSKSKPAATPETPAATGGDTGGTTYGGAAYGGATYGAAANPCAAPQ